MQQLLTGTGIKPMRCFLGVNQSRVGTSRGRRRFVEVLIGGLLFTSAVGAELPMTGTAIPSLFPIDNLVSNFMATYKVPGGAVGFVRDGKLLFVRGYGYADTNTQEVVQPDSLFRLASLSKAVTAAAILKLVEQGQLTLDQPAFAILNYPTPTYPGATTDPRLVSITIRQLLNHTGGWNRNTAINPDGGTGFDPTVNWTVRAAADLGTNAPANATAMVLWMLGKPLQFNPGTQYQYSNFGYTVLGRIIEKITGTNYEQHIQSVVAEASISRMRLSGSRRAEKLPGEVTYYDYPGASLTTSIFPEDPGPVPWPYNFSYPTMDSHGGLAASVIDLLRFASAVDGRAAYPDILSATSISNMTARPSPPWGATQEPYYGMGWFVRNTPGNWWHDGALPGTRTEMVRAGNGFTWGLLFNTRAQNDNAFFTALDNLGWQALAAVSVWPTNNLFDAVLTYAAWRPKHFTPLELADPLSSGDGADFDADGLANYVEFALGLGPKDASPTNRPSFAIQMVNSLLYPTLTFRRLLLAHEADYVVEVSSDLVNWSPTPHQVGTPILNTDGTQTVTFRDAVPAFSETARFMRLSISRQPN